MIEKRIGNFIANGREIVHDDKPIRPEVDVTIVSGLVTRIENKKNNSSANIIFESSGSQYAFNGYINENEPVCQIIKKAFDDEEIICLRFERKRKKDVDPTLSFKDITEEEGKPSMNKARDNIIKLVVGIYDFNNDKWILSQEAQSNPEEDPENIKISLKNISYDSSDFFKKPEKQTYKPSGKFQDNVQNILATYYFFLVEHEQKNNIVFKEETRKQYAEYLMKLSNQMQKELFSLEVANPNDYSHTKVRYLIFNYAEHVEPLSEDFKTWIKNMYNYCMEIGRWANTTASKFN